MHRYRVSQGWPRDADLSHGGFPPVADNELISATRLRTVLGVWSSAAIDAQAYLYVFYAFSGSHMVTPPIVRPGYTRQGGCDREFNLVSIRHCYNPGSCCHYARNSVPEVQGFALTVAHEQYVTKSRG